MSAVTIEELLSRLEPFGVRREGKGWKSRCPAHDDSNPSLSLGTASDGKPLVFCHAGCEYPDVLGALGLEGAIGRPDTLTIRVAQARVPKSGNGVNVKDTRGNWYWSKDTGLLRQVGRTLAVEVFTTDQGGQPFRNLVSWGVSTCPDVTDRTRPARPAANDEERGITRESLEEWSKACNWSDEWHPALFGVPPDIRAYLKARAIEVPTYSPHWRPVEHIAEYQGQAATEKDPAGFLALITEPDGGLPIGLQRVAVSPDGHALWRKFAPHPNESRGVVRLSPQHDGVLGICEGIETALSFGARYRVPVWSCLNAGNMARLPIIPGVRKLLVGADNDASGTGEKAARELVHRYQDAGIEALYYLPRRPPDRKSWDWNDVARAGGEYGN